MKDKAQKKEKWELLPTAQSLYEVSSKKELKQREEIIADMINWIQYAAERGSFLRVFEGPRDKAIIEYFMEHGYTVKERKVFKGLFERKVVETIISWEKPC
jgi:hypothetical protein